MNIPKKQPFGKTIKSPFGVPTNPQPAPYRTAGTMPKPAPRVAQQPTHQPQAQQYNTAINTFANAFTPIITKLPVKALPDYKPFADAGLEMARNAVEDSGIKQYCSFEPFKCYFNVTNLYVLRKLLLIIAPYTDLVILK